MNLKRKASVRANSFTFILTATIAAFLTYTSMYAVRKSFTAATFSNQSLWGIDYKIILVIAQTIGYTLSKALGIKIVAESTARQRPRYIIGLVAISVAALFFFALTPAPYNVLFLFLNGLPIGMIFGLVFNYLEGRRSTEILVTGLTITQIFSSGLIKSIGQFFMHDLDIAERWMPFAVGFSFFPVLLCAVWLLELLPVQSEEDIVLKSERVPLDKAGRRRFMQTFFTGLFIFLASYVLMTAYRNYRDNFAAEIWQGLGFPGDASLFTLTEIPVSLLILLLMIFLQRIRDNMKAFLFIHFMGIAGAALLLGGTILYAAGMLHPVIWISVTGIGLYVAYVPANTVFFERLIAVFRYAGNAGFIVIMADFYGYCGSFAMLLYKNFSPQHTSYSTFFLHASWITGILLLVAQTGSCLYFARKYRRQHKAVREEVKKLEAIV